MSLVSDWKAILKRAWSVRMMVLAALFSGLEALIAFFDLLPVPRGLSALLAFAISLLAPVFRVLAQRGLSLPEAES